MTNHFPQTLNTDSTFHLFTPEPLDPQCVREGDPETKDMPVKFADIELIDCKDGFFRLRRKDAPVMPGRVPGGRLER